MGICNCVSKLEDQTVVSLSDITFKHEPEQIECELINSSLNPFVKIAQALTRAYLTRKRYKKTIKAIPIDLSVPSIDIRPYLPDKILEILKETTDFQPMVHGELIHLTNGQLFIGNLKSDLSSGHLISTDSYYCGALKDLKYEGQGTLVKTNGDIYTGCFKNGIFHGEGDLICPKQNFRYSGNWEQGEHSGNGVEFNPDGSVCKAKFLRGVKSGDGVINWQDGSTYSGSFHKDQMSGIGKFSWSDGRVYEGSWKNGQMHGKGVMEAPDGRHYEGEFVSNKKEGFGVYVWPDGRKYSGSWKDGKQHGIGVLTELDKKPKKGEWKLGKRIRWIE